jgi:hypothetical protein
MIHMRPFSWSQTISRHDKIKVIGRNLHGLCYATKANDRSPSPELRLSNGKLFQDIRIYLEVDDRPPSNADGSPLTDAIGRLHFQEEINAATGWISLRPQDLSDVWEQVRQGGYSECLITIYVQPVKHRHPGWEWDVVANQGIYITNASIEFVRIPPKEGTEPPKQKQGWLG